MALELLLNLVWLALAVTALALWVRRRGSGGASEKRFAAGCLALACISLLLFPIISATDDSQALAQSSEGPGAGKRVPVDIDGTLLCLTQLATFSIACAHRDVAAPDLLGSYSYLQTIHITSRPPPLA